MRATLSEQPDASMAAVLLGRSRQAPDVAGPGVHVWMVDGTLLVVPIPSTVGATTLTEDLRAIYGASWINGSNLCVGCRLVAAQRNVEHQAAENSTIAAQVLALERARAEQALAERGRLIARHQARVESVRREHPDLPVPIVLLAERSARLDEQRSTGAAVATARERCRRLDSSASVDFVGYLFQRTGVIAGVAMTGLLLAALDRPLHAPRLYVFALWLLLAIAGLLLAEWFADDRIDRRLGALEAPAAVDQSDGGARYVGAMVALGVIGLLALLALKARVGYLVAGIMVGTTAAIAVAPVSVHLVRERRSLEDAVSGRLRDQAAIESRLTTVRASLRHFVCGQRGCPACAELVGPPEPSTTP